MNILFLTFYYAPDLSAGSFRAEALVREMEKQPGNLSITILTTQPNRYDQLSDKVSAEEKSNGVTIHRITLPSHKSGVFDQGRAFLSYAFEARRMAREQEWDVVVATSSRLMTAFLGALISKSSKAPLYLDIRDLFVDTVKDVFNPYLNVVLKPILRLIEKFTFNSASKLNVVSEGFLTYVDRVVPSVDKTVLTNGVDKEFIVEMPASDVRLPDKVGSCTVLYAGNVGEGQGLHKVIPDAARMIGKNVQFKIIGSGGRIRELREAAQALAREENVSSIDILPPMPRAELIKEYEKADILFVHLNDYEAFKKVLPSKIFEYAATGKPLIAGLSGYAAEFVRSEVEGALVFKPCNSTGMADAIKNALSYPQFVNRTAFCEKFARAKIMQSMAKDIVSLAK